MALKFTMSRSGSPQADSAAFNPAVFPPLLDPQLYTKKILCLMIRSRGAANAAASMNRNLSRSRCGCMVSFHLSKDPVWQYAAAIPFCDGSMSRTMSLSCPGINRFPGCHPKLDVASAFVMMSMFSASRADKKRTTCFAFSDVTVHPRSARTVMPLAVKIVDRG